MLIRHLSSILALSTLISLDAACVGEPESDDVALDFRVPVETQHGPGSSNGASHQSVAQLGALCDPVPTLANMVDAPLPGGLRAIHPLLEPYHADTQYGRPLLQYLIRLFSAHDLQGGGVVYEGTAFTTFDWGTAQPTPAQLDSAGKILALHMNDNGTVPLYIYGPDVNYGSSATFPVMKGDRPKLEVQAPMSQANPETYVHEFAVCRGGCGRLMTFHMGLDTMDLLGLDPDSGSNHVIERGAAIFQRMCPDPSAPCPVRAHHDATGNPDPLDDITYTVDASGRVTGATDSGGVPCHLSFVPASAIPSLYL